MRQLMERAMRQCDDLVVEFDYCDSKGAATHRVVSPIRFLGSNRLLGLCLSREEPRQFHLDRCSNVRIALAANFLMPVPLRSGIVGENGTGQAPRLREMVSSRPGWSVCAREVERSQDPHL